MRYARYDDAIAFIARSGDPLPGAPDDTIDIIWPNIVTNDFEDSAFRVTFNQGGPDQALLAYNAATDTLRVIAQSGMTVNVAKAGEPEDLRTIDSPLANLDQDDGSSALNNRRELAYTLTFTDGSSGVFVTTLGPLPCNHPDLEPPYAQLDLSDANAFITAWLASDPSADLAQPFGTIDAQDIDTFITAFLAGCP